MDLDLPDHQAARSWAGTEFATLDCSDARRCRRFVRVASDFIRNPAAAIPAACGDWAGTKACYRLFDQPEVNSGAILAAHRAAMLERLRAVDGGGTLLVLQDATSLNYDNHRSKEGLGPTAGHGKDRSPGIFVHGQLVACTDGAVHGLASALVYARQPRGAGEPAGKRNRQPLKEKESYRWVGGWHEAQRLWALEVRKIDPPPGVEPVCWQLLTTEPVADAADAARLVGWYALRWRIEDFHRVLKTGCRVESRQVRAAEKLKAFIALDMVVAVHLLSLVWQARISPESPESPVAGWLDRDEWEVLAVHAAGGGPPPERPPATREAVRTIARLGGFLGRKSDGEPGPEVLWRGLAKLRILVEAWRAFTTKSCG